MTLSQEAFLAFSGAILIGVAVFAVVWTAPRPRRPRFSQKRFRVVDRATGEVVGHFWTRRGAWSRAHLLNWRGRGSVALHGSRPRFGFEKVGR